MSGIAFILKNQEVSESPLGVVHTFAESAEAIATSYCTAIADATYKPEIKALVMSLYKAGLYNKFYTIYPMLGSTLAYQKTNLVSPGTNDAFVGANGSAGADGKHIQFVNTIGVGSKNPAYLGNNMEDWATITCAKKDATLNGGALFWFAENPASNAAGFRFGTALISGTSQPQLYAGPYIDLAGQIKVSPQRIITYKDTANTKYYGAVNGGAFSSESYHYPNDRSKIRANVGIGADWYLARNTTEGATITADTYVFGGDVYFHAIGKLTKEEALVADGIVAEFLAAVKGI